MDKRQSHGEVDLKALMDVAVEAAKSASETLMARFRPARDESLNLRYKGPGDPITDADLAADRAISEVLRLHDAPGNVLSEESSYDKGDTRLTWLIDPLCGTLPYSTGLAHFGVSIALRIEDRLEMGVVSLPASGEILSAIRGEGAYVNGERLETTEPPGDPLNVGIAIEGETRPFAGPKKALAEAAGRHYTFGSAAYPLGQVLLGRLHGAVFTEVNVHTAGSVVLARELGTRVTDETGKDLNDTPDPASKALIVAWPLVHAALLERMRT